MRKASKAKAGKRATSDKISYGLSGRATHGVRSRWTPKRIYALHSDGYTITEISRQTNIAPTEILAVIIQRMLSDERCA